MLRSHGGYKAAPFRVKSFLPTSARLSRINHCVLANSQISWHMYQGCSFGTARWGCGVLSWAVIAASGSVTQSARVADLRCSRVPSSLCALHSGMLGWHSHCIVKKSPTEPEIYGWISEVNILTEEKNLVYSVRSVGSYHILLWMYQPLIFQLY